jgi:uncharacterized protein (DUF1499 family)
MTKHHWPRMGTSTLAAGALVLLLGGCAGAPSTQEATPVTASERSSNIERALACSLPTNCVNSLPGSSLSPLRYPGDAPQALALLRATLAEFPEAQVVSADDHAVEAIFSTPAGFKDRVSFRIDATARRIDYRSGSTLGLFDFGKNRSRMEAFAARFEQRARP